MPSVVSAADLQEFLDREIHAAHPSAVCHLEASEPLRLVLNAASGAAGPAGAWPTTLIMAIADLALRAAIRARAGPTSRLSRPISHSTSCVSPQGRA